MSNNNSTQLMANEVQLTATNIYSNQAAFTFAARMSEALSKSTFVPKDYQSNPSNCLIALDMANRIGTAPLMVMQNLYIVNGKPSWSSSFIVAMINNSKKYKTELQYALTGSGDDLECYAYALDHNNHMVVGPTITMKMAKAEGWVDKNGSKWKTMPEVMIRYRAASFFGRLNCPDMVMGIYTADEVIDLPEDKYKIIDVTPSIPSGSFISNSGLEPGEIIEPDALNNADEIKQPIEANGPAQPTGNGNGNSHATGEGLNCADCKAKITKAEHSFSTGKYGRPLCRVCQTAAKNA